MNNRISENFNMAHWLLKLINDCGNLTVDYQNVLRATYYLINNSDFASKFAPLILFNYLN